MNASALMLIATTMLCQQAPNQDAATLQRFNAYRQVAGLPPVVLDPQLSKGCKAHAAYLARNVDVIVARQLGVNSEDPNLPGYSVEGARTAKYSYSYLGAGPAYTVDWLASTFFGRTLMLHPNLKSIGLGYARDARNRWFTVVDMNRAFESNQVILYPGAKQQDVPLSFRGPEFPSPLPAEQKEPAGFPITATFPMTDQVTEAQATLTDGTGKEVPAWFSSPEKPAFRADFQRNTIGLIPKQPLQPNTSYTVTMSAKFGDVPWRRVWTFTTGADTERIPDLKETALDRLNHHRRQAGLNPVTVDENLSEGCTLHARYLAMHLNHPSTKQLGVNDQDPKLPGYDVAGRRAAKAAIVANLEPLPAMDAWMGMFFSRLHLLDSELRRIGVGRAKSEQLGSISVVNVRHGRGSDQLVFFPADKQRNVPLAYGGESPSPVPNDQQQMAGYPISVMFPEARQVESVYATLKDGKGQEVAIYVSAPDKPAVNVLLQRNTIGIIPKTHLRSNTIYTVEITANVDEEPWSKKWSFSTGTGK